MINRCVGVFQYQLAFQKGKEITSEWGGEMTTMTTSSGNVSLVIFFFFICEEQDTFQMKMMKNRLHVITLSLQILFDKESEENTPDRPTQHISGLALNIKQAVCLSE